ncbi:hypothetical protein J6V85_02115 [Candidatus Saccharibacteria bacterium]|nr:hypothetical protein [Candidatus Saccharibacteria bacterium]
MLFFKTLEARRLAKKALRIVYSRRNAFRLWRNLSDEPERFIAGALEIRTTPVEYIDGSDLPNIKIFYFDKPVLDARVRGIGANLGGYQIHAFHDGDWVEIIDHYYKLIPQIKRDYKEMVRAQKRRDFASLKKGR